MKQTLQAVESVELTKKRRDLIERIETVRDLVEAKSREQSLEGENAPVGARRLSPGIEIVSRADVEAMKSGLEAGTADADVRYRNKKILERLDRVGTYRVLTVLGSRCRQSFDDLAATFPHCVAVLSHLRAMCALALRGDRTLRCDPLLIVGPPGTGKSTFFERAAAVLGLRFHRLPMNSAQASFMLAGSETHWANSDTGFVFKTLIDGDVANPMVLLDELDKMTGSRDYDPMGPLYTLLEPSLASSFTDWSVPGLRIDASRILWVATTNDISVIPAPILHRFVVYEVPEPDMNASRAIVESVDGWLRASDTRFRDMHADEAALKALLGLPPRQVRKRLLLSYGLAANDDRLIVTPSDVAATGGHTLRPVGFR